jgi:predicted metal-dependent phosphoesterase TrpH
MAIGPKIDLHVHSTSSDGTYTPVELIDLAIKKNLIALAITDHDTVDGLKEGMRYAQKKGFDLIPGVEFSIEYTGGSFHLLGLYVDHENSEIIRVSRRLKRLRFERIERIIEDLRSHGIDVSTSDLDLLAGNSLGRPHVARALVSKGYGVDVNDIFKRFLVKGKPGYVKKEKISLDEAIQVIKQSGGITSIAHPISLNCGSFDDFDKMVGQIAERGVEGIEVYSSMHTREEVKHFQRIAAKYTLLETGGSDFHGDKENELGMYDDGEPIPLQVLDVLREYRLQAGFR